MKKTESNILFRPLHLSTGEAARACLVSRQTVVNWIQIGRFSSSRIDGGPRRVPLIEVLELLRRNNMEIPEWLQERQAAAAA